MIFEVTHLVIIVAALIIGAAGAWLLVSSQQGKSDENESKIPELIREVADLRARKEEIEGDRDRLRASIEVLSTDLRNRESQTSRLKAELDSERTQSAEKIKVLTDVKEQLSNSFKLLAGQIFEDNSKRFTEQSQKNLSLMLEPMKEKFGEFKKTVEDVYVKEGKERFALSRHIEELRQMNVRLSDEANNLTVALQGQSKAQGDWGELILERLLEESGLSRDLFYFAQESHARDDGSRVQPDVVIKLPGERFVVVDSKVSLNAYTDFVKAGSEEEREDAGRRHIDSMRAHIRGLAGKDYPALHGIKSLDMVLMFVPIEPAYILGLSRDDKLWVEGLQKNVQLVSPSTLLFMIKAVAQLWRQEQQTRNVQEIAKRGAELYDKFVNFTADLSEVGNALDQAQGKYHAAFAKLTGGRGNLVSQAEKLIKLGVRSKKRLPQELVEASVEETLLLETDLVEEEETAEEEIVALPYPGNGPSGSGEVQAANSDEEA